MQINSYINNGDQKLAENGLQRSEYLARVDEKFVWENWKSIFSYSNRPHGFSPMCSRLDVEKTFVLTQEAWFLIQKSATPAPPITNGEGEGGFKTC